MKHKMHKIYLLTILSAIILETIAPPCPNPIPDTPLPLAPAYENINGSKDLPTMPLSDLDEIKST